MSAGSNVRNGAERCGDVEALGIAGASAEPTESAEATGSP